MKIFAIDIGHGTQDVMVYSDGRTLENNPKVVLMTPARGFGRIIDGLNNSLAVKGYTIGGGPLRKALKDLLARGHRVALEERAALTIRNNFDQVRELGFTVHDRIPDEMVAQEGRTLLHFDEIQYARWAEFFKSYNEEILDADYCAIAVQDHGLIEDARGTSRETRFEIFRGLLEKNPYPWALSFIDTDIPPTLARFISARDSARAGGARNRILLMDTSTCAMYGALLDEYHNWGPGPHLTINFGNNHITAYVIDNWRILSFFEHHTPMIKNNAELLTQYFKRAVAGDLTMEEVLSTHGSGYHCLEPFKFEKIKNIIVTGPNREIIKRTGFPFTYAVPAGDMMMAGPVGLIGAIFKFEEQNPRPMISGMKIALKKSVV